MSLVEEKKSPSPVAVEGTKGLLTAGEETARATYLSLPAVAAEGAKFAELVSGEMAEGARGLLGVVTALAQNPAQLDRVLKTGMEASPAQPSVQAKASAPKADV